MVSAIANKITAFILVFILFAHNINTLAIIGDFIVNQEFIAKTLCIQKSNQQGCNGKCHLSKELKKTNPDSNTPLPTQQTKRFSLDAFCFYKIDSSENEVVYYNASQIILNSNLQHIISTYFDIETPPPVFS